MSGKEKNRSQRQLLFIGLLFALSLFFPQAVRAELTLDVGGSCTISNQAILKDSSPTAMVYFNITAAEAAAGLYSVDTVQVSIDLYSNFSPDMVEYFKIYTDMVNDNTLTPGDALLATSSRFPGSPYTFTGLGWTIPTADVHGLIVTVETSDTLQDVTLDDRHSQTSFAVEADIVTIVALPGAGPPPVSEALPVSGIVTAETEAIDYTPHDTWYTWLPAFSLTRPEERARPRPDTPITTLERQTVSQEKSQLLPLETPTAVLGLDIAGMNETLRSVTVSFSRPRGRDIGDPGEVDQTFDGANHFDPAGTVDFDFDRIPDGEDGFDDLTTHAGSGVAIYRDDDNDGVFDADGTDTEVTWGISPWSTDIDDDTWSVTLYLPPGETLEPTYDNQPDYFIVIRADSGFLDVFGHQDGSGIKFGASFRAWIDNSDVNFTAFNVAGAQAPNPSEPSTLEDFIVDADGAATTTLPSPADYDRKHANLTDIEFGDNLFFVDDDGIPGYSYGDDIYYEVGGMPHQYNAGIDIIILIEGDDDISIADGSPGLSLTTALSFHTVGVFNYSLVYFDANGNGIYDLGEDIIRDDNLLFPGTTQRHWNPERGLGFTLEAVDHIIDADGGRNPASKSDTRSFAGNIFFAADTKYPPLTAFVAGDRIYYIDRDNSVTFSVKEVIFLDGNGNGTFEAAFDSILVNVDDDMVLDGTVGVPVDATGLRYYDANRNGAWDEGEDIIYSPDDAFYQVEVKIISAVYAVHDYSGYRIDATSSIIPVLGINVADTAAALIAEPKIQSIRVDFETVPGFEPRLAQNDPNNVDGDSDLAPLSDDMTSGVSLWRDNKVAGNVGVMDPVIDLIIDADGGSRTISAFWGAGTPAEDDTKADGVALTQLEAGDSVFFVDMDGDGIFSLGDGLFWDDGDNRYIASLDTLILRWKGDMLGFADGDGIASGDAGSDRRPNVGKLVSFDSGDNVYWADVDGSGTWTRTSNQRDGLWIDDDDGLYEAGESVIVRGDMTPDTTTGVELTADFLFAFDDAEVTANNRYDAGEDIHFASAIDAAGDLRLRFHDANGNGVWDNGEDIIYDGNASGHWDDPHDTFVRMKSPLEWTWDEEKSIWYVLIEPDELQDLPPHDRDPYWGDDYFIAIRTDDDITYEDKIQVTIPSYPSPGGVGVDDDDPLFARAGVLFTTGGEASENVDGSAFSTRVMSAQMPVFLQDLTYAGQEIGRLAEVAVLGINLFNDSGRTVTLDGIMIELYNQDELDFSPHTDLYRLTIAHDGIDNDGDGYIDDRRGLNWDPDLSETRRAGVVVYQDTNGDGIFDPTDKPVKLFKAPTFVADPGEPTALALHFHNDFVSNAAIPLDRHTQVPPVKDTQADYFIVLRTSAYIDDGDDFSVGIVGWGPLGAPWADDSALIFSEGVNSVFPPWTPPGGFLESRSYEKIETHTLTADIIPPGLPIQFKVSPEPEHNVLSWSEPPDPDFRGVMVRYIKDPVPAETYPRQNADDTFTGTQIFGGTFAQYEAVGQTRLTLRETAGGQRLSDWFSAGDTLRLGPNSRGQGEIVTIADVTGTDDTADILITRGLIYAYESGVPFTLGATSLSHTGLTDGTRYNYALFAYDDVPGPYRQNFSLGATNFGIPGPGDITPPPPITNFVALAGDGRIYLSWTNPPRAAYPDFERVRILRRTDTYPTDPKQLGSTFIDGGIGTSHVDTHHITTGVTYYYTAFAFDRVGNYSVAVDSARGSATPPAPAAPAAPDAACFIATAAYGTPLAGEVEVLSRLRDEYLLTNEWGRRFVAFYYRHSPQWAAYIEKRPALQALVRHSLRPLIWSVRILTGEEK